MARGLRHRWGRVCALLACAGGLTAPACAPPLLATDGTLVFQEKGAHGASIVTANGVEFRDRADVPERVVVRDASEPWRAPIGFILPASGRFTETSRPTVVATTGLAVALRPSDTRVPSWGGEVLVRIDVLAPAAEGTARWGENVVVVLDGRGPDTAALVTSVLGQLGGRDRVTVLDDDGAVVVLPTMPASHRSMAFAAVEAHLGTPTGAPGSRDLALTLRVARLALGSSPAVARVVVLTDVDRFVAPSAAVADELAKLRERSAVMSSFGTQPYADERAVAALAPGGMYSASASLDDRTAAVRVAVPPAGRVAFEDVRLTFEGTPAPSHVLEASGGDVRWDLDSGELALGDVRAGDERTEVVRVTVPPWSPAESFRFTVTAAFKDLARGGEDRGIRAELPCIYDDDIERIANSRHGDVIAYASALATLKRLDAAFVGPGIDREGGLYKIARMHARSMSLLARDTKDRAIREQSELLDALLAATAK